jgi:hypothetical protein
MKIKMTKTIRAHSLIDPEGKIFLLSGLEYEAKANKLGAISGLCECGEWLGVKPHEFEFIGFPILCEYDRQNVINYFEKRIKEWVEFADSQDRYWYDVGNSFHRGFYDALEDCLMWLREQNTDEILL